MDTLKDRLARLTPEQRAALLRKLGAAPGAAPAGASASSATAMVQPAGGQTPAGDETAAVPAGALSPAQQRMWVFERMTGDASAYTIASVLRIRGALDPVALEGAINAIVRRHEALRTTFVDVDGVPEARIADALHIPVEQVVLETGEGDAESALHATIRARVADPFVLDAGPLLRLALVRMSDDDWALVATMHHIIADGWSLRLIERELSAGYAAHIAGGMAEPPVPALQYRHYVAWQHDWLQRHAAAQLAYWTRTLEGAPPCWSMPTVQSRHDTSDLAAATRVFTIDEGRTRALRALAEREKASLFMVLAAASKLVLGLYAGSRDLSLGTPVANRRDPRFDGTIGLFSNTVVLRTTQRGGTFRDWLAQVRLAALDAFAHQDVPFDHVVDALRPERSPAHPPLFQMLFALQATEDSDLRLPGLEVQPLHLQRPASEFDFILEAFFGARDGHLALTWRRALFDEAMVQRLQQDLLTVLDAAIADPGVAVGTLVTSLAAPAADSDAMTAAALLARHLPAATGRAVLCAEDVSASTRSAVQAWAEAAGMPWVDVTLDTATDPAQDAGWDALAEALRMHAPHTLVLGARTHARMCASHAADARQTAGSVHLLLDGVAPDPRMPMPPLVADTWRVWSDLGDAGPCLLQKDGGRLAHRGRLQCVNREGLGLPACVPGEFVREDAAGTRTHTGLRGYWHADGAVVDGLVEAHGWIEGRLLDLDALAATIRRLPGVADAVVLPRRDRSGVWRAVACVAVSQRTTPARLWASLAEVSGTATRPHAWVAVSRLPRGSDGRIDTVALARLPTFDASRAAEPADAVWTPPAPAPGPRIDRPTPLHAPSGPDLDDRPLAVSVGDTLQVPACAPSLPAMLARAAREHPAHGITYLDDGSGEGPTQTYRALADDAARVLAGLREAGVRPGDRVLLQFSDNRSMLTAFWACVLGGAQPIPVAVPASDDGDDKDLGKLVNAWPALALSRVLSSRAHAVSVDALARLLGDAAVPVLWLETLQAAEHPPVPEADWHAPSADDTALLLLTSGSTGLPKAVIQSHAALVARSAATAQRFGFDAGVVSFNWMPLDHVGGLVMYHLLDVYLGARQIQCATRVVLEQPLRWLEWMSRHRVTSTWAPNFAYALVNDLLGVEPERARDWDLSPLVFVLNGGESIVPRTARGFLRLLAPSGLRADAMKPAWGMSETCSGVTFNAGFGPDGDDADAFVSVGHPIPGVSIRIVDGDDRPLPEGRDGRLQIRGPSVTSGYLNNPGATDASFTADGWFVTGDLATLVDGALTITGREKDLIIVNGINYYGHEIEQVVESVPGVPEAHVAACGVRRREDNTDRLAVFYCAEPSAASDPDALRAAIARTVLERVGIPATYLIAMAPEELPRTSIGKIQRPQLAQRFAQGEFDARLGGAVATDERLPGWFHTPAWRVAGPFVAPRLQAGESIEGALLIGGPEQVTARLAQALAQAGLQVMRVRDAREDASAQDHPDNGEGSTERAGMVLASRRVDLGDAAAVRECLASLPTLSGGWNVLHCAGLADPAGADLVEAWPLLLQRGPANLLALAQAASDIDPAALRTLAVLSRGAFAVDAGESPAVEHAPLAGLLRSIAQEQAALRWRHVDLAPGIEPAGCADALIAELRVDTAEDAATVAVRRGVRHLPVLRDALTVAAAAPIHGGQPVSGNPVLPDDTGLTLITGGLGGIGTLWAEWLLRHTAQTVVTLGRTEPEQADARARDAHARLSGYGARYRHVVCDLCDPAAVDRLFAGLQAEADAGAMPALTRVFHLAGSFHETPVADESFAGLAAAMRAKTLGAAVLQQSLQPRPDVEIVHFGSVNGVFGGAGVAAYAAANAALHALAAARRAAGGRARCLAWSMWDELGMSRGYGRHALVASRGFAVLTPGIGLDSLRAALHGGAEDLIIGLDAAHPNIARRLDSAPAPWWRLRAARGDEPAEVQDSFGVRLARARDIDEAHTQQQGAVAEAASPQTRALAAIWKDVLRVADVRPQDNFFALGGDSIMAIQVVARAAKAGIALTSRALFEAQTLEALAASTASAEPVVAEQGLLSGAVPLGPAQAWFFGLGLRDAQHMNQSVLLRSGKRLDTARLARALSQVAARHDMLRARCTLSGATPALTLSADTTVEVRTHALPDPAALTPLCDRLQAELDFAGGPLFRAHLLQGHSAHDDRLLLVAHHLLVDGVSWRLIVDALEEAYAADAAGEDPLPKGSSYRQWVEAIGAQARSEAGRAQLPLWLDLGDAPTVLPEADAPGEDLRGGECSLDIALDIESTRALVQRLPALTGLGIEALLVSALQRAHAAWTGADSLLMTLEGHGRDLELPGIDITRTVGWFTSLYPVRVRTAAGAAPLDAAADIGRQLAAVPQGGALQLAMRFLGEEADRRQLGALPAPAISFNYLGRFDEAPERLLSFAPEAPGAQIAPTQQRIHAIDVVGAVHEERLRFSFIHGTPRFRSERVRPFADAFLAELQTLAAQADAAARAALVVPDALQASLQALGRGAPERWVERILPASPMQTGLIYDSETSAVEGAYVSHLVNELEGALDADALRRAWQALVDRHDVYRSGFVAAEDGRYHAVIATHAELPWHALDWRDAAVDEQDARFEALVADDARRGFDLAAPPLLRIHLVRMDAQRHRMLVSEHHAVSDGWSRGIVLAELAQLYRAFAAGRAPGLAPAPSFATYIDWLSRFDREQAIAHWSRYLDGMPAPQAYAWQRPAPADRASVQRWHGHVDAETSAAVTAFARTQRTTVSSVVQTAWAMTMAAHTGSDEVAFLTTHSGRPGGLPDVERIVGPFIQTVPVRVRLAELGDVAACSRAMQRKDTTLVEHGHLPLYDICAGIGRRELTTAFHTYFLYENFPLTVPEEREDGLRVAWVKSLDRSETPLMVMAVPGDRLELLIYFREDLFAREDIDGLIDDFRAALRHVAADPTASTQAAAWLAPERREVIEAARRRHAAATAGATPASGTAPVEPVAATTTFEF